MIMRDARIEKVKRMERRMESDVTIVRGEEVDVTITKWFNRGRVSANANRSESFEIGESIVKLRGGEVGMEIADGKRSRDDDVWRFMYVGIGEWIGDE